jgi:hypothetical protein
VIPLEAFGVGLRPALGRGLDALSLMGMGDLPATIGWATVEMERAEREMQKRMPGARFTSAPGDSLLGARVRLLALDADPASRIVLLEPSTEGRLAGSLARFGEGPVALYLHLGFRDLDPIRSAAARAEIRLSTPGDGPFGRSVLLVHGPAWGPHLLLVELSLPVTPAAPGPGTIGG